MNTLMDDDVAVGTHPGLFHALRLKLFGPSQAEVWRKLANQVEGRFEEGGLWTGPDRVVAEVGSWQVVLDTYCVHNGKTTTTYTRLRAPYVNADGFRFLVYRKHLFSGVADLMGMQDAIVGDAEFDEQFIVRGNDEVKLQELFDNTMIRRLVLAQPRVRFEVKEDGGFFACRYPEGVDELRFTAVGVITDLERLRQLYDLFAATLNQLCAIGSAYEDPPGVRL